MNLNIETIFDFYTHKNKKILCQIKVTPSTNLKLNKTCRCFSQKQWNTFDKELEKLIITNDDWNDEKCLKFKLNSCIEVKVQKSKLTIKDFYKCLGAIEDFEKEFTDGLEETYILECLIDFQLEVPLDTSLESEEYEPQIETTPEKLSSPLSYEPYTPSKKKYRADNIDTIKTQRIDLLECHEDTYSPKPIFPIVGGEALLIDKIPKYTPAPIKKSPTSTELKKSQDLLDKIIVETGEKIESLRSKLKKKSKKAECEYIPKSQEYAVVDVPVYIPTPIGETAQRTSFKSEYNIKKHRKRSKTIDEFPGLQLDKNTNEKHKTINEYINSNKTRYHYEEKNFKKRSKTIDEMPAGFAVNSEKIKNLSEITNSKEQKTTLKQNIYKIKEKTNMLEKIPETTDSSTCEIDIPVYVPTAIADNTWQPKVIKSDHRSRKHKKRSNTIDEFPGQLHNEHCKENSKNHDVHTISKDKLNLDESKHLRKRSKTIDEMPNGLYANNENQVSKNLLEEKKGNSTDKTTPDKARESKRYTNKTSPITNKTPQKAKNERTTERSTIKTSPPCKDEELRPNKTSKKSSKIFTEENADKFESSVKIAKTASDVSVTEDTTPTKVLKRERKQENSPDIRKSLRRSERPPSKPIRLLEEQQSLLKSNKSKKQKTSPKNKELFGTDDEDDDDHFENNSCSRT
ncbi:uncharacterized protein LOC119602283 [Lucilia sericata]|uniref:uncharacterized protein LOC119602283 n=1 Tax=Lucilia sericata TaxID=13632 RepID=UPI0018A7FA36|nr:uncharacterized protein LOC119602283 [Lucilia sericata]